MVRKPQTIMVNNRDGFVEVLVNYGLCVEVLIVALGLCLCLCVCGGRIIRTLFALLNSSSFVQN